MRKVQIAIVSLLAAVVGVTPIVAADDGIRRTAGGKPDLTGVYDISSLTPFARPAKYGDQLFLTREEAEAIEKAAADRTATRAAPSDPNRPPPEAGGNVGAYNDFWFEWGTDTFEVDGKFRTSILTDPPNGQMPAMTDEGKQRQAKAPRFAWENKGYAWWLDSDETPYDGPENMVLGVRCLYQPTATIPARPLPYNNLKTVVQTEDHVMIQVEWMHWARVIRLNAEHAPAEIRSLSGDSIGWWEDDTLVVETTNFLDAPDLRGEGLRVVEKFTPISGETLRYAFTVDNPEYVAPYSGEFVWPRTQAKNFEYACHEGNYAMGNMLRGARLLEDEWRAKESGSGND